MLLRAPELCGEEERISVCKSVCNPWHRETRAHTHTVRSNLHRMLAIQFKDKVPVLRARSCVQINYSGLSILHLLYDLAKALERCIQTLKT